MPPPDETPWQLEIEAPEPVPEPEPPPPAPAVPLASRPPTEQPPPSLPRLLEALLFLGGPPLTWENATAVIRDLTAAQMTETIDALNAAYRRQGRPYLIRKQDHGYVLDLRPTFRFVHERLQGGVKQARLSAAVVEVLSVVAFRQPVTKAEVDTLRGHDSGSQLRQLLRRGLIAMLADNRFGTTQRFLELFGLNSLDDLPRTEDLQRL